MMPILIILDVLLANLTSLRLHLIIFGIPFLKDFSILIGYFAILAFFDYRYLINLAIFFILYRLDRYLNGKFRDVPSVYIVKVVLYYTIYALVMRILNFI